MLFINSAYILPLVNLLKNKTKANPLLYKVN